MNAKNRVRKHRANLRQQDQRRLEVWIHQTTINQMRKTARALDIPFSLAIAGALESYLCEYQIMLNEGLRLEGEQARLIPYAHIPEYRPQIVQHNQELAVYRARVATFQRQRSKEEL